LGYIPLIQEGKTKLERPNAVAKRAKMRTIMARFASYSRTRELRGLIHFEEVADNFSGEDTTQSSRVDVSRWTHTLVVAWRPHGHHGESSRYSSDDGKLHTRLFDNDRNWLRT
jgi:hypothetical protein